MNLSKICSNCKIEKKEEDFHKDQSSKTRLASSCKICAKQRSNRFYRESDKYRQSIREGGLKHRFGITIDDYYQMLKDQNGVCAICKNKSENNLHVDHNHDTGDIRGLLCKTCNHGLGNFKDSINYLNNAIEYLDRNSGSN